MNLHEIQPKEHGSFEEKMMYHMEQQTKFLEAIYGTLKAAQTIISAIKWFIGLVAGGFGFYEFLKYNFKL